MAALVVAVAALLGGVTGLKALRHHQDMREDLQRRVEGVQPIAAGSASCEAWLAGRRPLVVVAMGQSNAANHGDLAPASVEQSGAAALNAGITASSALSALAVPTGGVLPSGSRGATRPPMAVLHDGRCVMARDPLPGGTGSGASIWTALNERLQGEWNGRPIIWSVMAVEATSLDDWTDEASPLRRLWEHQIEATVSAGWPITAVLWQQGEMDAIHGTSAQDYGRGLRRLRALTEAKGLPGPWWLAKSTYCPPAVGLAVREAVQDLVEEPTSGFRAGPDTDAMPVRMRNGCHFNAEGVEQAAVLWQKALMAR